MTRDLWVVYTRILFVEAAYWIISIGMVFINQFVLSDDILTDDLTVFITIFQILFALSILLTLNHITKHYFSDMISDDQEETSLNSISTSSNSVDDNEDENDSDHLTASMSAKLIEKPYANGSSNNPLPRRASSSSDNQDSLIHLLVVKIPHRLNLETCKVVFPLSILYIGMLLLNNFCLKNVGVAFYFVSRSLTTVFNVVFTRLLINEPVSRGTLICCGFIVLGFILGIDQESVIGSLSVLGVVFGVASSLFTSLFSIYTKKTLAKLDKNIWTLVLYNNINAILLCTPLLIVHGDVQALVSDKVINPTFWTLLSISGVMAFFISIVTNASIKYTSPLTHNISGTAKACLQTVIAVIYYHDHKSTLWWLSNITILVASAAYSRIKQLEMERRTTGSHKHPGAAGESNCHLAQTLRRDDSSSSNAPDVISDKEICDAEDSCSVKFQLA